MASKTQSHGSPNVCPICCKAILDATKTREGQEALECEGTCQKWIHRWCAGVHKQDYPTLSNSSDSWTCPSCHLKEYGQLIKSLVNTVETLKAEVVSLKKQVNSKSCPPHEDPKPSPPQEDHKSSQYATAGAATTISPVLAISASSAVQPIPTHAASKSQEKGASPTNHNRKFNIVEFGVSECPKGTNRQIRQNSDLNSIATIISSLNTDVKADSISDCFRLGRFDPKHHQPRPLLVSLIRSSDVQTILANRSKLSKPIVIKPHMSPEERFNESLLLKVRWKLIQQGTERKSIKIQGTRIYASKKLVGQISNSYFEYSSWSFELQGSDLNPVHTNDPAHTNNPALTNNPIHTSNTINPSPTVNDSHSN